LVATKASYLTAIAFLEQPGGIVVLSGRAQDTHVTGHRSCEKSIDFLENFNKKQEGQWKVSGLYVDSCCLQKSRI
jgi:hypothetical protein